jgi:sterol desaturase/sphingolipid hydroxylase (fatty acid hydroxylase superfamily)
MDGLPFGLSISTALPLWLLIWGGALFLGERLFPAQAVVDDRHRLARNLGLGLILFALSPVVQWLMMPVALIENAPLPLLDWFGPIAGIAAQLLILDLWTYGLHRAYHRVPLMWRLHGVHHLDAHLDVTSAIRFHAGEVLLSSVLRLLPLYLFGIALETNAVFGAVLVTSALFHHSNIRLNPAVERALSILLVTPSIHWVHHHAVRRDTDANYAAILSVWDRIFASRSITPRTPDMVIGMEGEAERSFPVLMLWPFRR